MTVRPTSKKTAGASKDKKEKKLIYIKHTKQTKKKKEQARNHKILKEKHKHK